MIGDLFKKKKPVTMNCICGHDVMMHGFQNMGCSVMLAVQQDGETVQQKCKCGRFEAKKD